MMHSLGGNMAQTKLTRDIILINPKNLSLDELDTLNKVALVLDLEISRLEGIKINTKKNSDKEILVEYDADTDSFNISYPDTRAFARALSHLREVYGTVKVIREKLQFDDLGFMVDLSRNAVLTVESMKLLTNHLALMGYNTLFLYMEDTYEVPEYPYFGYQRGAYSPAELKEIDDYAYSLGVEVIPCVQTLAHLRNALKWPYAGGIKDTADVLLVGEEKTYEFIAALLKTLSSSIRSRRIHIGMDEAWDLGRGKFQDINGAVEPYKIFEQHLNRVLELTKAENYEPMIWSDMYFRMASAKHTYYDMDAPLTEEMKAAVPKDVDLVYWDYYNTDPEVVNEMLRRHKEINDNVWFAGGIWNWNGIKANHGIMFRTSEVALQASKDQGIKSVFTTAWGDDGQETSVFESLIGAQYFGEAAWNDVLPSRETTIRRYSLTTGADGDAFYNMRLLDEVPGVAEDNLSTRNPSKYILWSDPLTGLFDVHISAMADELVKHYGELADYFDSKANDTNEQDRLFLLQSAQLADVLERKVQLTSNLRPAYLLGDRATLQQIVDYDLPELIGAITDLQAFTLSIWYLYNKPQGSEIIDLRFGTQLGRLKTCLDRVDGYLKGVYDYIPELETERLSFDGRSLEEVKKAPHVRINTWHNIVSASGVSFGV